MSNSNRGQGSCSKTYMKAGSTNFKQRNNFLYLLIFLLVVLVGCENRPGGGSNSKNDVSAVWDTETSTLKIAGSATNNEESVQIHDAADGSLLGMALVKADGTWSAVATTAACDIHVTLADGETTFAVENSPANCTGSAAYARAISDGGQLTSIDDIPANVLVVNNPVPLNTVPNAIILNPPQDLVINAGQIVNFQSTAVGTGIQPPFSYFWNFGGAAPNSPIQNPGSIRFDVPGTYFIQLSVSDNLGIPDPTPAIRTITVNGTNSSIGVTPVPSIIAPTALNGLVSVNVGESLFFAGTAVDSTGSPSFTYEWNFSGIYPTQFGATAGNIPFNNAGTYVVSLYATNALGIRSTTPATVTVQVGGASGVNQAPDGSITRPRNDVTINVGESLSFRARGTDPDNTLPLLYSWDFQGVAPNINRSTDKSAGSITFNTPGIYYIRMTVTDSQGASDPNPPVRTVTVQNTTLPPPGGNGVLNAQISSPPSDVSIAPGQSVFFSGQVATTGATGPLQYFWNFGGAAVDSNLQTPGSITFPFPGQFFVTFFATDSFGNVQGIPASRTITVADPSNVDADIISPANRSTINVGQPMNMVGQVKNNTGFTALTYSWRIRLRGSDTNLFTSNQLSPGSYVFTQPGEYRVRFEVSGFDPSGNPTLSSRDTNRVTVVAGTTPAPNPVPGIASTGISLPLADMVIYAGNEVDFEAARVTGGTNIRYNWDFNGVRSSTTRRNPSPVTFNTPGTFFVTLQVTGSINGVPINIFDQRTITVLQQNPSFPPGPVAGTSGTSILLPTTDQFINVGDRVDFEATRVTGTNIRYNWDFGGARSPTTRRNPNPVTFNSPGTFLVTLLVTGTVNGVPINNFDQRTITVFQATAPFPPAPNPAPLGTGIMQPATDVVINMGQSVDFEANRVTGGTVTYSWDFSGARSPSTRRDPSPVQFNTPGSFLVSVQISGTLNNQPFNQYDHRVVTVMQTGSPLPFPPPAGPIAGTSLPDGFITQPAQTVVNVRVGQPVQFAGSGFDPQGLGSLSFQWSFGGARRNINAQNPGSVTFNRVGTYVVTLLVENAVGQFDTTPPSVVVSVTP